MDLQLNLVNRFFTLLLAASCLTAVGQVQGDFNDDGCVQLEDLLGLLGSYGNCGFDELTWDCGDPINYQGYDYETVLIGEQCWFAENLRCTEGLDGTVFPSNCGCYLYSDAPDGPCTETGGEILSSVYGDECYDVASYCEVGTLPADCNQSCLLETYGLLYQFGVVENICPLGWHVPTDHDWSILVSNSSFSLDGAGSSLSSDSLWIQGGGTNSSGFNALPGGWRLCNSGGLGIQASFWSATPSTYTPGFKNSWSITFNSVLQSNLITQFDDGTNTFLSIRCIKDAE